ncbi:hypothetical protein P168DRAFT_26571 [Aspergillus campestris IBT 28561]|uniref:Uncharacterized protein n=1 Tax=Aspergillus campestris (strain IBT 28561) TaxID=1392248 RepID=A0A2I1DGC9_ASPC2|nr:uncharacterized protein P168DRAFT_26571 [Aspergillus campestris IBT 28561]PKY08926.1 hypothetical protein P168DRAFT_26571 [Aspergillus campestris IBT 28561]
MDSSRNSHPFLGSPPRASSPLSIPPAPPNFRQSIRAPPPPTKPDTEKEELRIQNNTLKYELENLKQERDLVVLRHEKELRDLQLKADADFRKFQVRRRLHKW